MHTLPLPHKLRPQHQPLDAFKPAVDLLIVAGQADRLDDGDTFQRLPCAFDVEVFYKHDRAAIGAQIADRASNLGGGRFGSIARGKIRSEQSRGGNEWASKVRPR